MLSEYDCPGLQMPSLVLTFKKYRITTACLPKDKSIRQHQLYNAVSYTRTKRQNSNTNILHQHRHISKNKLSDLQIYSCENSLSESQDIGTVSQS
jgi:hypothetical protein